MSPNSPQSNYSKKTVKRVRLLKFGPPKSKGLFEEYFYGCLAAIFLGLLLLLIAGGMDSSTGLVTALWLTGLIWFGWQVKRYFKEKSEPAPRKKRADAGKAPVKPAAVQLSPNLKPMIGPQWPLKMPGAPVQTAPSPGGQNGKNKPVFVYERPTLPDRKPKLPANWPGQQPKKPAGPQDKKTK